MGLRSSQIGADDRQHFLCYEDLSLLDLIERITDSADRRALHEFHEHRTPFRFETGRPLRFAEYLDGLRQSKIPSRWSDDHVEVADTAYDLTLDKFGNLPVEPEQPSERDDHESSALKRRGTDCHRPGQDGTRLWGW